MTNKTETEVIIGGKLYKLVGYENEDYLQKIANYINKLISDYTKVDTFRHLSADMQNVLLELNIADEYFKAKNQISIMEEDLKTKENEMYDLKHKLIAAEIKLEQAEKNLKDLQKDNSDKAKEIIRLETELKSK